MSGIDINRLHVLCKEAFADDPIGKLARKLNREGLTGDLLLDLCKSSKKIRSLAKLPFNKLVVRMKDLERGFI